MSGRDKRGPRGEGPMTGRGMGYCDDQIDPRNEEVGSYRPRGRGGMGRGRGPRDGRGRGMGPGRRLGPQDGTGPRYEEGTCVKYKKRE